MQWRALQSLLWSLQVQFLPFIHLWRFPFSCWTCHYWPLFICMVGSASSTINLTAFELLLLWSFLHRQMMHISVPSGVVHRGFFKHFMSIDVWCLYCSDTWMLQRSVVQHTGEILLLPACAHQAPQKLAAYSCISQDNLVQYSLRQRKSAKGIGFSVPRAERLKA